VCFEVGDSLLLHAESVLGLVKEAIVALGRVLLARSLVRHGLGGAFLAVWDGITLDLVTNVGDALGELVDGGLGALRGALVGDLVAEILASGIHFG